MSFLTRAHGVIGQARFPFATIWVRLAILAFLPAMCLGWPVEARADQLSVEAAAQAAGLEVRTGTASVNGTKIYYRDIGTKGETVVLLHGFPETGDAFAAVVGTLAKRYRLIVPDLRGAGRSQRTAGGYEKRMLARDIKELLDFLRVDKVRLVGHDIGARVGYAFALQYPQRLHSLVLAEAFIEGLSGTALMKMVAPLSARTRHFARFADVAKSVATYSGDEEGLVLSFMNSRSKTRIFTTGDVSGYVASLKGEGALRSAFMLFEAFDRDAEFAGSARTSAIANLPVLALACDNPLGNPLQRQLAAAGLRNVQALTLKDCAHWIWEENPAETLTALTNFLEIARLVH